MTESPAFEGLEEQKPASRLPAAAGKWLKRINERLANQSVIGISQAGMRREELRNIYPIARPDVTDSFMGEPEHMQNWERMSAFEQRLFGDILPGFAESPLGQKMAEFGEGWLGKIVVNGLNALAEAAERPLGMAYQVAQDPELLKSPFSARWDAAYEAGRLFYETMAPKDFGLLGEFVRGVGFMVSPSGWWDETKADIPNYFKWITRQITDEEYQATRAPNPTFEQWIGTPEAQELRGEEIKKWWRIFKMGGELDTGGLPALIEARKAILAGGDVETVRQEFAERYGALWWRAEAHDAIMKVAIDPLNYILPRLGIVEGLHSVRQMVNVSKLAPEVTEGIQIISKLGDVLSDATRLAESGEDAATLVSQMMDAAKTLEIDDITRLVNRVDEVVRAGGSADDVAKVTDELAELLARADVLEDATKAERVIFAVTGGDPLNPPKWTKLTDKLPKLVRNIVKLPTLTAASRATEFTNTVNTTMRILMGKFDDAYQMVAALKKGAGGAFGSTFGHMFLSPVGRHVQGVLKYGMSKLDDALKVWDGTQIQRNTLHTVARILRQDPVDVLNAIQKGSKEADAVMNALTDAVRVADDADVVAKNFAEIIDTGQFSSRQLVELGEILKSTPTKIIPFDIDTFRAMLISDMSDAAMEMAIVQFGVQEMGVIEKATNVVKSAESLVLLGLNPQYPIQNFFNNEITMMARGVDGFFTPGQIDEIWDLFGITPRRLGEGFTIAGEEIGGGVKITDNTRHILLKALGHEGTYATVLEMLGKTRAKDFRALAAYFETMASRKAFTNGMLKSWRKYWRAGKGYTHMDDFSAGLSDILNQTDVELSKYVDDAIRNAKKPADIDAIRFADDLKFQIETISRRAAERLGIDPDRVALVISEEMNAQLGKAISDLGPRPAPDEIRALYQNMGDVMGRHLDASMADNFPAMVEEFAAKSNVEGALGVADIYGEVTGSVAQRMYAHSKLLDYRLEEIFEIRDFDLAQTAWKALQADANAAWTRTWDFAEAAHRGILKGLKKAGIQVPDKYLDAFKSFRGGSQDFIKLRNRLWEGYMTEAGKLDDTQRIAAKADIYTKLDEEYIKLMDITDQSYAAMDDVLLGSLGEMDDTSRLLAQEWRMTLRELRRSDMQDVLDFRQSTRHLDRDARKPLWEAHWKGRISGQQEIVWVDKAGRGALMGDETAINYFTNKAAIRDQIMGDVAPIVRARTPQEAVDAFEGVFEPGQVMVRVKPADQFREGQLAVTRWSELRANPSGPIRIDISQELISADDMGLVRNTLLEEFVHAWQIQEDVIDDLGDFLGIAIPRDNGRAIEFLTTHTIDGKLAVEEVAEQIRRFYLEPNAFRLQEPASYAKVRDLVRGHDELDVMGRAFATMISPADLGGPGSTLSNFDELVGRQMYFSTGIDELWFEHGSNIMREMENETLGMLNEPSLRFRDLPEDVQARLGSYLDHATGQLNDTRHASVRMAEGMRDSALLNYTRQTHFDTYLGMVAPFQFWYTHSISRWLLHSLDRPFMFSTYAKMREYMNRQQENWREGFPARLRGKLQVDMPFAPEHMGDTWIDPFRMFGIPFEHFLSPLTGLAQSSVNVEQATERQLRQMESDGEITEEELNQAINTQGGPIWDRAQAMAHAEDSSLRFDIMDFMSLSTSPHLPLTIAHNLIRGTPENISALPPERALRALLGIMQAPGISDITEKLGIEPGMYDNTWGNVRRSLGLSAYDQWDEYILRREISNMTAEGLISLDVSREALTYGRESDNPAVQEAIQGALGRIESTKGFQYGYRLMGIPVQPYPEGEERLRNMYDEFYGAMERKDEDPTALRLFFDKYPEFETRLALWKKPEEQLRDFLVDNIWSTYNELDTLNKREAREHLGSMFTDLFLSNETRSIESIPAEILQSWNLLLRGEVGMAETNATVAHIPFTDPEVAARLQPFYNEREQKYLYNEFLWPIQKEFFQLDKEGDARDDFLAQYPILEDYWDWRKDFMYRNPDLAPYLEDDPDKLPKYETLEELRAVTGAQPIYTWHEWTTITPYRFMNLMEDWIVEDTELSFMELEELQLIAEELGLTVDDVLDRMELAYEGR